MTDRELLELAAKAACYDFKVSREWHDKGRTLADGDYWNPLTDDGDALRLALNLGLTIETAANGSSADAAAYLPGRPEVAAVEWVGLDPNNRPLATRRAIVRAAAEIGKGMS